MDSGISGPEEVKTSGRKIRIVGQPSRKEVDAKDCQAGFAMLDLQEAHYKPKIEVFDGGI